MEDEFFDPPRRLTFEMERPRRGFPSFATELVFRIEKSGDRQTVIGMPLEVASTGFAQCGASTELVPPDEQIATLDDRACIVSPGRQFALRTVYRPVDALTPESIAFFGVLEPASVLVSGAGRFYIGGVPGPVEEGTWIVRSSP